MQRGDKLGYFELLHPENARGTRWRVRCVCTRTLSLKASELQRNTSCGCKRRRCADPGRALRPRDEKPLQRVTLPCADCAQPHPFPLEMGDHQDVTLLCGACLAQRVATITGRTATFLHPLPSPVGCR